MSVWVQVFVYTHACVSECTRMHVSETVTHPGPQLLTEGGKEKVNKLKSS